MLVYSAVSHCTTYTSLCYLEYSLKGLFDYEEFEFCVHDGE